MNFRALGGISVPTRDLEVFACPQGMSIVSLDYDELTSLCPVTGQPDIATARIVYAPRAVCIESKSLKLYFWTFRNEGLFCEALASRIVHDLATALDPSWIRVRVVQKRRGGIEITSIASWTSSTALAKTRSLQP